MLTLNLVFSFAFFVFLYKFVPLYLVTTLGKFYPALKGRIAFNAADGLIRIAIFVGLGARSSAATGAGSSPEPAQAGEGGAAGGAVGS